MLLSMLVSFVVSVGVYVFLTYFGGKAVLDGFFVQTVRVPAVVGMDIAQATAAVSKHTLTVSVEKEVQDPKAPKGAIVSQNPAANIEVKKESNVMVVISNGMTTVPKVFGMMAEDAKAELALKGLAIGAVREQESSERPGAVLAQEPAEAGTVAQGTAVALTVSKGVGLTSVPRVTGKTLAEAKRSIAAAGLKLGNIKETTSEYYQFDIVLGQEPAAGAKALKGSAVTITVNTEEKGAE